MIFLLFRIPLTVLVVLLFCLENYSTSPVRKTGSHKYGSKSNSDSMPLARNSELTKKIVEIDEKYGYKLDYDIDSDNVEYEIIKPRQPIRSRRRPRNLAAAEFEDIPISDRLKNRRSESIRIIQRAFKTRREMMHNYFMSTTSFVHGDSFLGLGRTTSGILFGYFSVMYCVYILSTTLLLYQRRNDPSLAKLPLYMSHFVPAGFNAFIVVLGFCRHMFRAKFPCFLVLWTYGLVAPMYVVFIYEARSLNLIFEYHWNKRMQSLLQSTEPVNENSAPMIVVDRMHKKAPEENLTATNEDWMWIKKNGMTSTILGIFIFQFIMTFSIQILSPHYTIWPKMVVYRCAGALETILPMMALFMYMFVIPLYLFIQLKRINDSYGVRKDIYSAVTQSAWIVLLFSLVRHVFFVEKFIGYVPTGFAVLSTFGIIHYHTVCAPLLRIYIWQWSRSRVKRKMKKFILLKRTIESYLFPRFLRIKIDKLHSGGGRGNGKTELKAPEPIKASQKGELRQKPRVKSSCNPGSSPNTSPTDSRLYDSSSPAASMSPIIPPELKPPTFNQVLQDDILCELFERYTLLEFSRENLLFYRAVCGLRSTFASLPTGAAQIFLVEKSRSLASQFIHINAPAEVNIPGPVRKRIESRLAEYDVDLTLFDEAQREVFRLMQNWSYPRFLRTLPDAEIRRFNKKARRNSTNVHLETALATLAENGTTISGPTGSARVNVNGRTTRNGYVHISSNHRRQAVQNQDDFLATSVSSLTLPLNIAEVSLSSSP